tara:strand:- start:140 stop:778 length:639 start_codon:yes stop_codon:yes gene_type:complete
MHHQNNMINILCIATNDFSNSMNELKEHLNFNLSFLENNKIDNNYDNFDVVLIHEGALKDENISKSVNKINSIKMLIARPQYFSSFKYDEKINLPIDINELNKKVVELNMKKKFSSNSSIQVKNYILDKNEKKLKKNDLSIVVTEKEVQLIELLFNSTKHLKKKIILQEVWKYSSDADTHTVETHIYRLRKKIIDKFQDDNFIINTKSGYII